MAVSNVSSGSVERAGPISFGRDLRDPGGEPRSRGLLAAWRLFRDVSVVRRQLGRCPDDLPRIFTAFFHSERSRSRETGGVGLGLTLAKRIVEAHGGAIDVTSALHAGTSVRVTIPA